MLNDQPDPALLSRRRWRMRFGVGTMLLLTAIFCAVLGTWSYVVQPYRRASILSERIIELGGRYESKPGKGPQWQRELVETLMGAGAFQDLIQIDLESSQITSADVRLIGQMRKLQTLNLDRTDLTDEGALRLAGLSDLTELSTRYTKITDRGASALVRAPRIRTIWLTGCEITDRTLEAIPDATNLQQVFARWSAVSEAGVEASCRRIPSCQIHWTRSG